MINNENVLHYFDTPIQAKFAVRSAFHTIGRGLRAMLYEPVETTQKASVCILIVHSDTDYLDFAFAKEIAAWGYKALCANVETSASDMDKKMMDVGQIFRYAKALEGVQHIVLLGHSGGASLMSAYQCAAENGPEVFQGPEKLVKSRLHPGALLPADGLMLLDSNWGNGAMRLFSLDPAVTDESDGMQLDPDVNLFDPKNGFVKGGSQYTQEFIERFQKAQGARNNRLTEYALQRLDKINSGCGHFEDDEPMIIPGADQAFFNNKLFAQDTRLLSHTRGSWPLLHGDGSISVEQVFSVRKAQNDESLTSSLERGALITTVKRYLSSYAIRTTEDYSFTEDSVSGVDWDSSYNCTPGNVQNIHTPLLIMGMTGSWEFSAAETIAEQAGAEDVTLAYVEGARHFFDTATELEQYPGQYGDTMNTTCRFVDAWLKERYL